MPLTFSAKKKDGFLASRIAAGFSKDLREEVFEKVTHFSNENLNTLEVFDSKTETFQTLSPMKHARQSSGVATLNGFIYVAGGWDGTNRLDVVEKYSNEDYFEK